MPTNVSLICTVRNEEKVIKILMDSITEQTRPPNEIIIVDGGSSDNTVEAIRSYMVRLPNLRLIVSPGTNIARGRNIAIKNATYDVIVSVDGGCKLHPKWLENIVKPLEETTEIYVVSGVYLPWYETEFEEITSYLIFPDIEKLDTDKFLPSGRSIAFRKKAWENVGGYPEWLDTAEDTLFDLKLKKAGMKIIIARNAIVYWRVREDIKKIFKQFYNYAKGDGVALLFPQRYLPRYAIALLFLLLTITLWYNVIFWFSATLTIFAGLWIKHLRKVKKLSTKRLLTAILVASTIEAGVFLGYLRGILTRVRKIKNIARATEILEKETEPN